MAEETKTLADLKDLVTPPADGVASQAGAVTPEAEPVVPVEPKIDDKGRSYATGKRKDAVARVWIKPGPGKITVNGRELETYFARPVLRMLINQPLPNARANTTSPARSRAAGYRARPGRSSTASARRCCTMSRACGGRSRRKAS